MNLTNSFEWEFADSVEQLKVNICIKSQAIFVGYLVCMRATGEFLVSVQKFPYKWQKGSRVDRVFSPNPASAKVFSDYHEALRAAQDYERDKPEVARFFDSDDKLLITFDAASGVDF